MDLPHKDLRSVYITVCVLSTYLLQNVSREKFGPKKWQRVTAFIFQSRGLTSSLFCPRWWSPLDLHPWQRAIKSSAFLQYKHFQRPLRLPSRRSVGLAWRSARNRSMYKRLLVVIEWQVNRYWTYKIRVWLGSLSEYVNAQYIAMSWPLTKNVLTCIKTCDFIVSFSSTYNSPVEANGRFTARSVTKEKYIEVF